MCVEKLGLGLSNNHAFRIALNSYVLILPTPQKGVKLSVYNVCGAKIPLCRRQLLRAGL